MVFNDMHWILMYLGRVLIYQYRYRYLNIYANIFYMGNRLRGLIAQGAVSSEQLVAGGAPSEFGVPFDPSMKGWDIAERGVDCNVWRDSSTGNEIQQYRIVANDQFQFLDYQKSFQLRFNSPYLMSSVFFRDETTSELCSKYYKGNLFLERVPLRLSDITQIPYPDVLHLYSQCFKGYAQLFDLVGYFDITEEMIVINSAGVVKVWHNKNLDRYLPAVSYHNGNEREMVLKVVRVISQNTNQLTLPDRVSDWIIRSDPYTFKDAFNSIEGYASRYNSTIPASLDCVSNFLRMKYVEEEEVYEGEFDLDPIPTIDGEALNRVIAESTDPLGSGYPYGEEKPPQGYTRIISESLFPDKTKRRRILQHKEFPVLSSNVVVNENAKARTQLSHNPIPVPENRAVYGHHNPNPHVPRNTPQGMQTSNPFNSVLQKLQISNHYRPQSIAQISSSIRAPEKDYLAHNPYVSVPISQQSNSTYPSIIQKPFSPYVSQAPRNSLNRYQGRYNTSLNQYPSLEQGKTSKEMLAYMRSFKQSMPSKPSPPNYTQSQFIKESHYQSVRQYPTERHPTTPKFQSPASIISSTRNEAVYRDVGESSSYVNVSYKNNDSVSFNNKYSVVEEVIEKKSVYINESVSPRATLNVDQEIKKDLLRFRSSKASRSSEVR